MKAPFDRLIVDVALIVIYCHSSDLCSGISSTDWCVTRRYYIIKYGS